MSNDDIWEGAGLGPDDVPLIVSDLDKLTELNLFDNRLGPAGMQILSTPLIKNKTISTFNIGKNNLGEIGAQPLADVIKFNKSIKSIDMSLNNIGEFGSSLLSEAIAVNTTLHTVYFQGNHPRTRGISAMIRGLERNGMIRSFVLGVDDTQDFQERVNRILLRNINAHHRCKLVVMSLLSIARNRQNQARAQNLQAFPSVLLVQMAKAVWATRNTDKWWLTSEGGTFAQQQQRQRTNACIGCKHETARFHEEDAPERLFCSSYCQFLERHGLPDVRGMIPQQVETLICAY